VNSFKKDVIIIGGGAAGLMCAIEAGKRGRNVLLIEHNERLGKKILISGGGRCNFTNLDANAGNYISENSDFCKSALTRYTPADFISLIEKHRISYHEKKLGQLFCDQSSRQIVDLLDGEAKLANVEIKLNCKVNSVSKSTSFRVETVLGEYESDSLVVATGGLSFPKLGASNFGYQVAKNFNLEITEVCPALVPLEFLDKNLFASLSGISIDSIVSCDRQSFRENILFTHRGLSGPAILQISSYWKKGKSIEINLLPEKTDDEIFLGTNGNKNLSTILNQYLPKRFVQHFLKSDDSPKPLKNYSKSEIQKISEKLHQWKLTPQETEGYSKAEVTLGGIRTTGLSSKTMESRAVKGLYFIGEVVDVTGWLGGYNFQWAWASGFAAGQFV
jgi:predicted Rossmann fold flavoprotein